MLKPLNEIELRKIFDDVAIGVFEFFMKKSVFSQPERVEGQAVLPIQMPKEHIEQWVVQAIGAQPVGAGSYPIDVIKPGEFGADVKMLSCKIDRYGKISNGESGETSLAQKFTGDGAILDEMFIQEKYSDIVESWKDILYKKLITVEQDHGIKKLYYIFILRAKTKFHLCATEVNIDKIKFLEVDRGTNSSVFVSNLIDNNFGNGKIYKAKKRLELRLRPKYWIDNGYTLEFKLDFTATSCNIRDKVKDGTIDEYFKNLSEEVRMS